MKIYHLEEFSSQREYEIWLCLWSQYFQEIEKLVFTNPRIVFSNKLK